MSKSSSYEENIKKLEEIVRKLERGEAPLEEALSAFEEGVSLIRLCQSQLDRVSEKVRILNQEGESSTLPVMTKEDE